MTNNNDNIVVIIMTNVASVVDRISIASIIDVINVAIGWNQ